jgi:uncharacterized membrane protein
VDLQGTIEDVGRAVDVVGVATIVLGIVIASVVAVLDLRSDRSVDVYRRCRERIGRAILLGLEVLVAADIIRTVAVTPTFESAGVLAIIVAIRTFLSWSLSVELEGRWPWSRPRRAGELTPPVEQS